MTPTNLILLVSSVVVHGLVPQLRLAQTAPRFKQSQYKLWAEPAGEEEAAAVVAEATPAVVEDAPAAAATEESKPARGNRRGGRKDATPLSDLEVGKTYEGTVTGIADYGCFVDIGAQSDGLVHISELSTGFVEDVGSIVEAGQAVEARILSVNLEKRQLSLSLKSEAEAAAATQRKPRGGQRPQRPKKAGPEELKKYADADPSEFVDGTVVSIKPFGAFVNIAEGVDGLVHISQISDERTESVEDALEMGQAVKVRIIDVDLERATLGLSMSTYVERPQRSNYGASNYGDDAAPSSGPRGSGRRYSGGDDDQDGGPSRGRPAKFKAAGGDDDEFGGGQRFNKPRRMDPGDDIWETKPHEQFDWQKAMAEVQESEEPQEAGITVDPSTGKLTLL